MHGVAAQILAGCVFCTSFFAFMFSNAQGHCVLRACVRLVALDACVCVTRGRSDLQGAGAVGPADVLDAAELVDQTRT